MLGMVLAATVSGASVATAQTPLDVSANGRTFTYTGGSVADFLNHTVAPGVYVAPVNATRKINAKRRRIDFTPPSNGVKLNVDASLVNSVQAAVDESPTVGARPVVLPVTTPTPSVSHFDKTIMVVLKQRRIYLYDNTKVVKQYRCAIGMPRYPTPTGTFVIRRKVKNPSWTNPGGAWGKGMPSYIKPGPSNPLGTRALYLYRGYSDTGVRFHGTTNRGSIGHAASHGCMRMKREDVEKFYKQVPLYTTVYIVK
jgi:lipoprotein-anchoring transpeptidase ErfK/SrfK